MASRKDKERIARIRAGAEKSIAQTVKDKRDAVQPPTLTGDLAALQLIARVLRGGY